MYEPETHYDSTTFPTAVENCYNCANKHYAAWFLYKEVYQVTHSYEQHTEKSSCPQLLYEYEKKLAAAPPRGLKRMQDELAEPSSANPNGKRSKKCASNVNRETHPGQPVVNGLPGAPNGAGGAPSPWSLKRNC